MAQSNSRKFLIAAAVLAVVWLTARYFLPILLPFLLGALLALASEPLVAALQKRTHLPRAAATGIGVTIMLVMLCLVLMVLGALALRQLQNLMTYLPDLEGTALAGLDSLEGWLLGLTAKVPDGIEPMLTHSVENLFSGGTVFFDQLTAWVLSLASGIVTGLPDKALGIGTWLIASFMFSAKLPKIRDYLRRKFGGAWQEKWQPALKRMKDTVLGWFTAQLKLMGITFLVLTGGFLLLRVRWAPLIAGVIALVDALPVLGTGMVLVPWSIVCFIQGETARGIGLLGTYAAAALLRSMLEPKLVGKQLGLDSLLTLLAMYAGYRLWGLTGLILAPIIATTAVQLFAVQKPGM